MPRWFRFTLPLLAVLACATPLASTATLAQSPPVAQTAEVAFWNSIEDSTDPEDFREYLRKFSGGTFAGLASRRLERLTSRVARDGEPSSASTGSVVSGSSADERRAGEVGTPPKAAQPVPPATYRKLTRHYVEGEGFETTGNSSFEICSQRCGEDSRCRMFEFYKPERKCNLFDHTRAVKTTDADAEVAIKQ